MPAKLRPPSPTPALGPAALSWPFYLLVFLLLFLQILSLSSAHARELPGLGTPLDNTKDNVAASAQGLTVFPNGRGLPAGSGTPAIGAELYARHCAACHGADGTGGPNDPLVGGQGSLATQTPQKTVGSFWPFPTTVFDYIRRSMPYYAPGSLSADEVYSLTAYLLWANRIIDESTTLNATTLPQVTMPNAGGFEWRPH